jgi:chromosome partitioning protein
MKVVCGHCRTGYRLDGDQYPGMLVKVRCARCHYVFSVYCTEGARRNTAAAGGNGAAGSDTAPLPATTERKPPAAAGNGKRTVISISNQKGGVAKTSTCLNLGISLAMLGQKVLMIDFDTQANLTIALGYRDMPSFFEMMHQTPEAGTDVIVQTRHPNLWLLPSNRNLVLLDKKYFGTVNFENVLRERLMVFKSRFDFILIDTPPSIGFFTLNALTSADLALVPSLCEYLSTHGTEQILDAVEMVKNKTNPGLDYRVLITMYDPKDPSAQVVHAKLMGNFKEKAFGTVIGYDTKMKESQIMKMPAIVYDKNCRSGLAYLQLAKELLSASAAVH